MLMRRINIFFLLVLLYLLEFFQNREQFVYFALFLLNFYNIIEFIFSQMQVLIFYFNCLKINLIIASKIDFIFFLTSTCNFVATKNIKKTTTKML